MSAVPLALVPALLGDVDPVLLAMVALMLGFVFFVYLMLRRTILGFKEGVDRGRGRG